MKKKEKGRKSSERIAVLLPPNGSHPYFLRSAVQLAKALGISVRLLVSPSFLKDRPHKEGFYTEFLEEEALRSSLSWDKKVYEDSLSRVFQSLSTQDDLLAILKNHDSGPIMKVALREASCPVLVIPSDFNQDFRNVMLAYIGGRFSEKALGIAAFLGKHARRHVEVLTVGSVSSPSLRVSHAQAEYFFSLFKVKAKYRILCGDAKETILKTCDREGVHLLIIGSSETSDWRDHRFRALSDVIAEEANCPVMVVK